jgi:hypothetical protein
MVLMEGILLLDMTLAKPPTHQWRTIGEKIGLLYEVRKILYMGKSLLSISYSLRIDQTHVHLWRPDAQAMGRFRGSACTMYPGQPSSIKNGRASYSKGLKITRVILLQSQIMT